MEKSLALVGQLARVEEFRKEMVKQGVHKKMVQNIEDCEKPEKAGAVAMSAVGLSRVLDGTVVSDIVASNGLATIQKALKDTNDP